MNVYDFDGTIYDGESTVDFVLFYVKKDPKSAKFLPEVLKAFSQYKALKLTGEELVENYCKKIFDYVNENNVDFMPIVKEFWDKVESKKIRRFYKAIQKPDDIVLTASPTFFIEEMTKRLGIKTTVGTDFDLITGEVKELCFREAKIDVFKRHFGDIRIDNFYTDSLNDECLFPISNHVYMVKKTKIEQIK